MTPISCTVCRSHHTRFLFNSPDTHGHHLLSDHNFPLYRCLHCQALFLSGVTLDDTYYRLHYPKNYYPVPSLVDNLISHLSHWQKQRQILKHAPTNRPLTVLDIGAGRGGFLKSLNDRLFIKSGLEKSPGVSNFYKNTDITFYNQDINNFHPKSKFNVITLWQTLEHLPQPSAILKKISHLLSPRGLLVFSVPNHDSLGYKLGQGNWFHLDSPRHLFIPNTISIRYLLDQNNLSLLKIYHPFFDFPLDLFWSVRQHPLKNVIYILYPIIRLFDPETLIVIARKK